MHHPAALTRVLLVEDDEDDYILTRELLSEVQGQRFALDWAKSFPEGLKQMCLNQHDVVLLDYRLGAHNGVELLTAAMEGGCQAPIILLTGPGQPQVALEARQAGASDYLIKTQLQSLSLERSIRYAMQRKRAAALAAFEQARLAAFGAEVGLILTRRDSLEAILAGCAKAMAQYLNASLAQIFTFDSRKQLFEPRAAAGVCLERKEPSSELPTAKLDIQSLSEGRPVLIRQVLNDERILDQEWAKHEGAVSYAAHPLVLEDKLVGLMSIFT